MRPDLVNPAFQGILRLAKSDPKIWADILSSNSDQILDRIKSFKKDLKVFESSFSNKTKLENLIVASKKKADSLL
jgi:prephenate dehydrogenase